ncbi:zinc finger protein 862-like [Pecten maximus]|uniref:zinc finger protein 862-like n=1 Tax=Pecten maximus TaxID=6579 RepID=UPI0014587750|nr:zinc finger protein 862-like [Pecten maximus]
MASDGASVMTGKANGVGARVRADHSPRLLQVHCVAHRLALAARQACRDVPLFDDFQRSLKLIYRYFHNSAVRYNQLRAVEALLQDDNMRCLSLKEPASSRWLSLEAAVTAILDTYPALLVTLDSDAAKGSTAGNAEAKGLLNRIKPVTFVLTTAFLKDVLSCVGKLSKVFQRDHVDVDTVNVMVDATLQKLESIKTDNGRHPQEVYDKLQQRDGYYQDVKIQDRQSMRIQFQTEANKYLDKLCENLRDRFEQDSLGKIQMLNIILNPECLPSSLTAVTAHGKEELQTLVDLYGGEDPLDDGDQLKEDFEQFKCVLKSLRGKSLKDSCVHIVSKYSDVFPDFAILAQILLAAPMTSVACERGFSSQNRLKTKARSCLKHATVTKLIRISEEGPSVTDFDPTVSIRKFVKTKQRRK